MASQPKGHPDLFVQPFGGPSANAPLVVMKYNGTQTLEAMAQHMGFTMIERPDHEHTLAPYAKLRPDGSFLLKHSFSTLGLVAAPENGGGGLQISPSS